MSTGWNRNEIREATLLSDHVITCWVKQIVRCSSVDVSFSLAHDLEILQITYIASADRSSGYLKPVKQTVVDLNKLPDYFEDSYEEVGRYVCIMITALWTEDGMTLSSTTQELKD